MITKQQVAIVVLAGCLILSLTPMISSAKPRPPDSPIKKLCKAASRGDMATVKLMIAQGVDVNARHSNGTTALYWAAYGGNTEIARLLLEKGADVNVQESREKRSPLHEAAKRGYPDIVKLLLAHKANVDARDYQRQTPLHLAADAGQVTICKLLIEHGADVNAKNMGNFTPLHRAAQRSRTEVAKLLLDKGADVNARMMYGDTPLDLASDAGTAKLLRSRGGKEMHVPYHGGPR